MSKPNGMDDKTYKQLCIMLSSPWYRWRVACGMKRPILPWRIKTFIHLVAVTKMAIRRTLAYDFYPETYIPRVEAEHIGDMWFLDVHTWGHPLQVKV